MTTIIDKLKFCVDCGFNKNKYDFSATQFNKKIGRCKNCISIYNKNYRLNNIEKLNENSRLYRMNNIVHVRKYRVMWEKNKKIADPQFKLRKYLSNSIYLHLIINKSSKNNDSILKNLLYSMRELKEHIEKQFELWMTWDNWRQYNAKIWNDNDQTTWTWQIDHIIPHSKLNVLSMEDQAFKDCRDLSNLRPLSAKQNVLDGFLNRRT